MNFYFIEMSGGKLLYARPTINFGPETEQGRQWKRNRTINRGSIRNEEDAQRGIEVRAQREREHRRRETGYVKPHKVNVHDRLTGVAPIAYIPPKK